MSAKNRGEKRCEENAIVNDNCLTGSIQHTCSKRDILFIPAQNNAAGLKVFTICSPIMRVYFRLHSWRDKQTDYYFEEKEMLERIIA